MNPGSTVRNVVLGVVYLFVVLAVIGAAIPTDNSGGGGPDGVSGATPVPTTQQPTEMGGSTSTPKSTLKPSTTEAPTTTATPPTQTTASPETSSQDGMTGTIVKVVDGDTMDVRFSDGRTDRIRLLGVDTPEVHVANDPEEFEGVPNTEAGASCLRDWGHKASEFGRTQLLDVQVQLTFDSNEPRRGSFGRLLVYVSVDGDLFNQQLIDQGYARMYDSSFEKRSSFAPREANAQKNAVGLWECRSVESATEEPQFSSGNGDLTVVNVHVDAMGRERENLNDEYVVFKNSGSESLQIGGWVVSDEASHEYTVPQGVSLASGATITLHTGSGSDGTSDLYWGSDSPIWNNGGDTVYVQDAGGDRVLSHEYS